MRRPGPCARCAGRDHGRLNLRTIAQLAGVARRRRRVLPRLVVLGVVERREVPPASLFRLVRQHVASRALLALARCTDPVLDEIGRLASLPTHR